MINILFKYIFDKAGTHKGRPYNRNVVAHGTSPPVPWKRVDVSRETGEIACLVRFPLVPKAKRKDLPGDDSFYRLPSPLSPPYIPFLIARFNRVYRHGDVQPVRAIR